MVDSSELRLNNWVLEEGKPRQIYSYSFAVSDNYDPIPLTQEILEKCGFEKNYEAQAGIDEFVYDKESINLILTQENEKWFYWNHSGLMIDPQYKYLHEIQNLIYILTGTELEINLTEKD